MMTSKMSSREPAKDMLKAFKLMDIDEHGVLGPQDLKRVASLLGESVRTTDSPSFRPLHPAVAPGHDAERAVAVCR